MDTAILQKEALLLPEKDRALLADRLLASLTLTSPDLEAAWIRESSDRLQAFQGGEISSVDGPAALADLKARFKK
ncbi:addiction module protein [Haloferula sargassicola]|uniref:addiction module protein n=1 Tax=Haloferula sargassicola TaxID=490096 RepID=UPI0033653C6A